MRKLTLILSLIFTVTLSSPSYAEWIEVGKNKSGDTFYVDFDRIRKHGEYVYVWVLGDNLKPSKHGDLSWKVYYQIDCQLLRSKGLSWSWHKEPMGGGTGLVNNDPDKEWKYPPPYSSRERVLKAVCAQ